MALVSQNSLIGANAQTAVPQMPQGTPAQAAAPIMTSPAKVANQTNSLQMGGMAAGQAVHKASINPENKFAKGGPIAPPKHTDEITKQVADNPPDPKSVGIISKALEGSKAIEEPKIKPDNMEDMLQQYQSPEGKAYLDSRQKDIENGAPKASGPDATKMAKGGATVPNEDKIKNMSLKEVMQLLATHPGLAKQEGLDSTAQGGQTSMRTGGAVMKKAHGTKESNPSLGTMDMNIDAPTYKKGGLLEKTKMASGGDLESDSVSGYGPDGKPIVTNQDGSQGFADINKFLDRPSSAPTLGTGENPGNALTNDAANSAPMAMKKGGEDKGVPPGSLKNEVADNIDAKLSEGEFVFSADSTRFWGLQKLMAMQDYARQELEKMKGEGNIRSPGDGQNPDEGGKGLTGKFMQDEEPDSDFYTPEEKGEDEGEEGKGNLPEAPDEDDMKAGGGLLRRAKGGMCYASGGDVGEEDSYARGGIVSSTGPSLTPKANEGMIPLQATKFKLPTAATKAPPVTKPVTNKSIVVPKPSGILRSMALKQTDKNQSRNINQTQSFVS